MKANILTWLASVISSVVIIAALEYARPQPKLVRVDIISLIEAQKKSLGDRIKPGMTNEEQAKVMMEASQEMARVSGAIDILATECGCAILNSAAFLKIPDHLKAIPDRTERVRQIMTSLPTNR